MKRKIVIAGGSGFIGRYLHKHFENEGFEVKIISRGKHYINWDQEKDLIPALEDAELLINLAGKSVDCRYHLKNKAAILNSRVDTTHKLQALIEKCSHPPKLWINSSTATIYRHAEDRPMDEISGEIGTGFSVDVAKKWERAFFERPIADTRKVALRMAIVLGRAGGVMVPFSNLVKFGFGGKQGSGKQMFSWLHVEDLFGIIKYLMDNTHLQGVYNCSAPNPVSNKVFMQELRKIIKPVFALPTPEIFLKIGAFFINTEAELILKSRWVIPTRLQEAGYQFTYAKVDAALQDILINQG